MHYAERPVTAQRCGQGCLCGVLGSAHRGISDRRADRQSVKWRTAVGGGSPHGPGGAATPVPGGERAGSELLLLWRVFREPIKMQRGSDLALTLHYKSPRLSEAICRNFGMFWGNRVILAAQRMKGLEDLEPLQNREEYTVLQQLHQTLQHKRGNPEVGHHEASLPRSLFHPPHHYVQLHKLNLRLLISLQKR
ncbi:hypothetical protein WMY93_028288 [Mugilogobius chulae]|uniref:Uncharacterized protein n=1 Tax=Mugilogobius chulae TaxID=88201 RepID=A0AAW0MYW4_9GOBI